MAPSSLQRALSQSNNKGHFEACFAQGLDLSELESISTTRPSASAVLLEQKRQESLQKRLEEQEEALLSQSIAEKLEAYKASKGSSKNTTVLIASHPSTQASSADNFLLTKGGMFDTLVGIHGGDNTDKTKMRREKRAQVKLSHQRLQKPSLKNNRKSVTKKGKQSKY